MTITKEDIGRRVMVSGTGSTGLIFNKDKGTIVHIIGERPPIGIRFDKKVGSHTCEGHCKEGYGYYVSEDMITFIDEKEQKENKMKKRTNTGIQIHTEKVVTGNGEIGYKILKVKALAPDKLPSLYTKSEEPTVYMRIKNDLFNCGLDDSIYAYNTENGVPDKLTKGKTYTNKEFSLFLNHCEKAGDNLMEVNKKLNAMKKEWNGKKVFKI